MDDDGGDGGRRPNTVVRRYCRGRRQTRIEESIEGEFEFDPSLESTENSNRLRVLTRVFGSNYETLPPP